MHPEKLRIEQNEAERDSEHDSFELASRRTGMSFQRTRMAADRTLMAIIRTALSLIGFGFTIYQIFSKFIGQGAAPTRRFSLALVALGVTLLTLGIAYHVWFMLGLRRTRSQMQSEGLIHAESVFPLSVTLVTAIALLLTGLLAILSIGFNAGPFG